MSALNTFVYRHIPISLRQRRDYTGPEGWCWLGNQILRRFEREGLIELQQLKEVGVLVSNDFWITLPSDFRKVDEIYYPGLEDYKPKRNVGHEIVNGKIKIDSAISIDEDDIDTFTLSSGDTDSVVINDDDAQENQWEGSLLVLTNGTYSGDCIVIGEHDAASGGTTTLNFLHTRSTSISDSTAGYLTDDYAVLKYWGTFTPFSAEDDEIPIDDRFEDAIVFGLCYLACPIDDERRKMYKTEFEEEIDRLKAEQFTPTPDQARPVPRPMAGLENCDAFPYRYQEEFVGDLDADLPD